MRVLVVNKFWYRRGGLERVMFDEVDWLEARGNQVASFATIHSQNEPSPWDGYYVPCADFGSPNRLNSMKKARTAARMFWNGDAAARFDELLSDFKPDVVHAHGIHRQISPSILSVALRHGVPVVQTVHDYHHICPADVLLYRGEGVCQPRRCRQLCCLSAVSGRCVRQSLAASSLSAAETSWQRVIRSYDRGVARFISPSRFLADCMKEARWRLPIDIVPNAVEPAPDRQLAGGGFAVIGRLSREKGVEVALAAARAADVKLTVAGEGQLGEALRCGYPEAQFTGRLSGDDVADLVRRSRAVVVPSLWYENAPMSVLEAMAAGVPVIASRIGGIPEQVTDGLDGLLVTPGDAHEFATAIRRLEDDPGYALRLGREAQKTVAARFSPERHLEGILASYRAAGARS